MQTYLQTTKRVFTETQEGRTILRFIKTTVYAMIGAYIATRTGAFAADWPFIVEAGILAGFGFSIDKGTREYLRARKK